MNMNNLHHEHIIGRLKIVHIGGICVMIIMFMLLFILDRYTNVKTLLPQFILLCMGVILAVSYLSILFFRSAKAPSAPVFFFFVLNVLTTGLVWATGTLQSPFILFYVILILITAQLYHYAAGIVQALLASFGFLFVFSATVYQFIPVYTVNPSTSEFLVYNHTVVVLIYGILYATLFIFTLLSSSNARIVLFRPTSKDEMDSTFQEHIIRTMPLAVLIVDHDLQILGDNPVASMDFPRSPKSTTLTDYLSLPKLAPKKTLEHLAKTEEDRQLTWKLDTGEIRSATVSVRMHKARKQEDSSFIVYLK